ncbi:hypothetical protein [Pseudomonas putida]|uniref:hypothetical protein n=1 Tax=Pseudomonas putida TaxID=303 RepID=UPI002169DC4A|nr:hypothetical protein [Pseudomonas putida]MCS4065485.1 hypothetical protein [Pseudomonas putida]
MSLTLPKRSAISTLLARTADNSAYYTALTTAEGLFEITEINELVDLRADPQYRLIRIDHRLGMEERDGFEIALVDDIELSVAYYDKVTLGRSPDIGRRKLASNLIWRSASNRHSRALRDISQKVLFSYMVNDYDILLDAEAITDGGNFYWHRQVSRAIEKGLHAYAYDPTTQALRPIQTQLALNNLQDQVWTEVNHKALIAIISNSQILRS